MEGFIFVFHAIALKANLLKTNVEDWIKFTRFELKIHNSYQKNY